MYPSNQILDSKESDDNESKFEDDSEQQDPHADLYSAEFDSRHVSTILMHTLHSDSVKVSSISDGLLSYKLNDDIPSKNLKSYIFDRQVNELEDLYSILQFEQNIQKLKRRRPKWMDFFKNSQSMQQMVDTQIESIKNNLQKSLNKWSGAWKIVGINIIHNPNVINSFKNISNMENSKILWHGTRLERISSIFDNGFQNVIKKQDKLDNGWYGKGFYLTSFAKYAIYYANKYHNQKQDLVSLIGCYVNCGNIREIEDFEHGKDIPTSYDTNFVNVGSRRGIGPIKKKKVIDIGRPVLFDTVKSGKYAGNIVYDEYCIKNGNRIVPRYCVTLRRMKMAVFIWRDAKIDNEENSGMFKHLSAMKKNKNCGNFDIFGCKTTKEVVDLVNVKLEENTCNFYIVSNGGDDGEGLVNTIRNELKVHCDILIFCNKVNIHKEWAKKYDNVEVTRSPKNVITWVGKHAANTKL